jgi:hypothetical protein
MQTFKLIRVHCTDKRRFYEEFAQAYNPEDQSPRLVGWPWRSSDPLIFLYYVPTEFQFI